MRQKQSGWVYFHEAMEGSIHSIYCFKTYCRDTMGSRGERKEPYTGSSGFYGEFKAYGCAVDWLKVKTDLFGDDKMARGKYGLIRDWD